MNRPHSAANDPPLFVDVPGARVAIHRKGTGPTLVCLHATGHAGRDFVRLAERLQSHFEFVAVDWPGQGDSPREITPASAPRYAELLSGVVDALDLKRFTILGNSIGGAAAMIYAAANTDRVRGLVLCNAGGLLAVNWIVRLYCASMAKRFAQAARGDRSFPDWFRRYYERVLPAPEAEWRRNEIVASGPQVAEILKQAWESFGKPSADVRPLLPNLSMPVFYAWGRLDKILPWSRARKAAMTAPRAEVKLYDAGHAPFLETPQAFDRDLVVFMSRLPT